MLTSDRNAYRNAFFVTYQLYLAKKPLSPLQKQILSVILIHPEYHRFLSSETMLLQNFDDEENPFLHMGMHLAIREQVATDRPKGITQLFKDFEAQHPHDRHQTEHQFLQALGSAMQKAQATGTLPNDHDYLQQLKQHLQKFSKI